MQEDYEFSVYALKHLLINFERSQTGDGQGDSSVRSAVAAIARAATSSPGSVDERGGVDPWRWIVNSTFYAERSGDSDSVAHVALFTYFYSVVMVPNFGPIEWREMPLEAPSDYARAAIYSVALRVLPHQNQATYVVWHGWDNFMQIKDVLNSCALEGMRVHSLLEGRALSAAQRLCGEG